MRGKDYSESSRLGDKYSDDHFNELKHANQWRIQKETPDANLYFEENENKENTNFETMVKDLVDNIETKIASKEVTSRASSMPKNCPSTSSNTSAAQSSNRPLRSTSADSRSRRGLSDRKSTQQPPQSDSPQRVRRGSREELLATSDELRQMLIEGTIFLIRMWAIMTYHIFIINCYTHRFFVALYMRTLLIF